MIDIIAHISPEWVLVESYDVDNYVIKREYFKNTVKMKEIQYALTKTGTVVDKIIPTYKLYNENGLVKTVVRKEILPSEIGVAVINKETKGATIGIKI